MEQCKAHARDAGLKFEDETLEYVITNRDMLELTPKNMIPTMYDYWVHDLQVFRGKKIYELYPFNPYETVINSKPAISFYNDNNPLWLNVMIFYHVLGHVDFFQNNAMFKNTWNDDFNGLALADKRLIAKLRSKKGRWVDYAIEFARSIDNLVNYYSELSLLNFPKEIRSNNKVEFYFDIFLSKIKKAKASEYLKEIERYNRCKEEFPDLSESVFFGELEKKYPEFEEIFTRRKKERNYRERKPRDLLSYLIENSSFLNDKENEWMKMILEIVRRTSLYFEPQRRTKIINEGWASYWHESLFLKDKRIQGHEVDFASINSKIMSMPRAGLNPYALGWRLLLHVEEMANKGKISYRFQKIKDIQKRKNFDLNTKLGKEYLLQVREDFDDFTFINTFVDQDFVDRFNLFLVGKRMNPRKKVWEYYVKSRDAEKYKKMLINSLYHPPHIEILESKTSKKELYLYHHFEEKPLVREYIENTMMGIEYLYGGEVHLETSEVEGKNFNAGRGDGQVRDKAQPVYKRVVYTMKERKLTRKVIQ